ncbi:MAG: hypothetical protein FJY20_09225 [Bacteroidetes bacterium]|nr:hypothetical protein [Bacteroidota bacterium]
MHLTCWNYTKEGWRHFQYWKSRKKGLLYFVFHRLCTLREKQAPEVRIAVDRVWVNGEPESFQNRSCRFREIHIREAGCIHILEISYEQGNRVRGINVPIPKGKLREAFEVQERLILDNESVG